MSKRSILQDKLEKVLDDFQHDKNISDYDMHIMLVTSDMRLVDKMVDVTIDRMTK